MQREGWPCHRAPPLLLTPVKGQGWRSEAVPPFFLPPHLPGPRKEGWGLFGPVARPTHAIIADCLAVAMVMASMQGCGAAWHLSHGHAAHTPPPLHPTAHPAAPGCQAGLAPHPLHPAWDRGVRPGAPHLGTPASGSLGSLTAGVPWEMSLQTGHVTLHPALGSPQGSGKGGECTGQWVHRVGSMWDIGCPQSSGCIMWWVHGVVGAQW